MDSDRNAVQKNRIKVYDGYRCEIFIAKDVWLYEDAGMDLRELERFRTTKCAHSRRAHQLLRCRKHRSELPSSATLHRRRRYPICKAYAVAHFVACIWTRSIVEAGTTV